MPPMMMMMMTRRMEIGVLDLSYCLSLFSTTDLSLVHRKHGAKVTPRLSIVEEGSQEGTTGVFDVCLTWEGEKAVCPCTVERRMSDWVPVFHPIIVCVMGWTRACPYMGDIPMTSLLSLIISYSCLL